MAFRAFQGRILARGILQLMAIDTGARLCGGVVECTRETGLHAGLGRFGVTVHASFLGRLERLLGLRRVVARLALGPDALDVKFVLKLHATHGRASQDDSILGLTLAAGWQHQRETEHDARGNHADNRRMLARDVFHDSFQP